MSPAAISSFLQDLNDIADDIMVLSDLSGSMSCLPYDCRMGQTDNKLSDSLYEGMNEKKMEECLSTWTQFDSAVFLENLMCMHAEVRTALLRLITRQLMLLTMMDGLKLFDVE